MCWNVDEVVVLIYDFLVLVLDINTDLNIRIITNYYGDDYKKTDEYKKICPPIYT